MAEKPKFEELNKWRIPSGDYVVLSRMEYTDNEPTLILNKRYWSENRQDYFPTAGGPVIPMALAKPIGEAIIASST